MDDSIVEPSGILRPTDSAGGVSWSASAVSSPHRRSCHRRTPGRVATRAASCRSEAHMRSRRPRVRGNARHPPKGARQGRDLTPSLTGHRLHAKEWSDGELVPAPTFEAGKPHIGKTRDRHDEKPYACFVALIPGDMPTTGTRLLRGRTPSIARACNDCVCQALDRPGQKKKRSK